MQGLKLLNQMSSALEDDGFRNLRFVILELDRRSRVAMEVATRTHALRPQEAVIDSQQLGNYDAFGTASESLLTTVSRVCLERGWCVRNLTSLLA